MKKITTLCLMALMSISMLAAPKYLVQTGQKGDPVWSKAVVDSLKAELVVLADSTKELDEWLNGAQGAETWLAAGKYYVNAGIQANGAVVKLYGGFAGTEFAVDQRALVAGGKAWEFANPTTIDGEDKRIVLSGKNIASTWNGITFINSNAGTSVNGGVARVTTNALIENCQFINCAGQQGGALTCITCDGVVIRNCYFEGNVANTQGGAIYSALDANAKLTIANCYFKKNTAKIAKNNAGGAIHVQKKGQYTIDACVFEDNEITDAGSNGAAISSDAKDDATAFTTISNCLISGSKSDGRPAIYLAQGAIYNNTIVNNASGAIYIANNKTPYATTVANNVIWGTTAAEGKLSIMDKAEVTIKNNAFLDSVKLANATVADNVVLDTLSAAYFVDAANSDFHLANDASAICLIQKGVDLSAAGVVTDLEGNARVAGKYDMGCYVYVGDIPTAVEDIQNAKKIINDVKYNMLGQPVGEDYRGIVIVDGKKYIVH